jgi:S1-C subfamily serine protease
MRGEELKERHRNLLYPTVRVRTEKSGGSGTIIYSEMEPDPDYEGVHETYVLTNCHVINDNIKVEKKWSTLLKREVKTDVLTDCTVETFDFEYDSWESGHSAYKGEIMCYDKDMDLALLKIKAGKKFEYVAKMFPKDEHKKRLRMFMGLYAVGCGMGHPPLATQGNLTGFSDIIDNYPYWLSSAPTIYGNSGGAVFLEDTLEFIGIPSRIAVSIRGFSADAITHLSYFIPIVSIYKFLEDQVFMFLYDSNYTSKACAEERKRKRDRDEKMMAVDISREEAGKDDN